MALKSTPEHASQQVELPTDPHLAAAIFLAVLAYPLPGEGDVGSAGERYAWALNVARIRDFKKLYPEKVASTLNLPTKRQIEGQLSRGASRILRRMTARDLWAELAISGVAPLIGTPTTAADARANRVAVRKVILKNPTYWANRFSLKNVDCSIPENTEILINNMRAHYKGSLPVIHLANALYSISGSLEISVGALNAKLSQKYAIAVLNDLVKHAPAWISKAVDLCIEWQSGAPEIMLVEAGPRIHLLRQES